MNDDFVLIHSDVHSLVIGFKSHTSVNQVYSRSKNKVFNTKKKSVESFISRSVVDLLHVKKLKNKYKFVYRFYFYDNRPRDISNQIKLFEDMVFKIIGDDDSRVDEITIHRMYDFYKYEKYHKQKYHVVEINWKDI